MFVYFYKEHKESEVTDIKLIALKLNVSRFEIRSLGQLFVNKFIKEKDLIREKHVHCS